jgi:DNA polymerase-3 subunit delta'
MDRIFGQPHAIDVLQTAMRNDRLHHAYVFHGPTGVGKFTTAHAFARTLLCHEAQPDLAGFINACGSCRSCSVFDAGTHPDMHVVTKELAKYSDDATVRNRKLMTIPVDVLETALIAPVSLAPRLGARKVFVVDEAELMSDIGQNKLLKTLEEPPAGTFIILVTSNEDRLLATVRSRCQRIAFAPLPDSDVNRWLDERDDELSADHRAWLIRFADGSVGQVQLAIEYDLYAWAGQVIPAIEQMGHGVYPDELGRQIGAMLNDFAETWVKRHDNASKDAANKLAAALMWRLIAQEARKRMFDRAAQCDPADPMETERRMWPYLGIIDALKQAEYEMHANVNMTLVSDHLVSMIYRALRGREVMTG